MIESVNGGSFEARLRSPISRRPGDAEWLADEWRQTISQLWKTSGHSQRRPLMNRFGRFAQEMWQELAPAAYSEIPDPNRHFSTLGMEAESRISQLADQLAGNDDPSETYWQKVARLETAKRQAEEIVRNDLLIPPPESQTTSQAEDEEPNSESLNDVMDLLALRQSLIDADQE